jgi:hypothetical protein
MSWMKLLEVTNCLSLIVETFCLEKKVTLYEDGLYKELFKGWPLYWKSWKERSMLKGVRELAFILSYNKEYSLLKVQIW